MGDTFVNNLNTAQRAQVLSILQGSDRDALLELLPLDGREAAISMLARNNEAKWRQRTPKRSPQPPSDYQTPRVRLRDIQEKQASPYSCRYLLFPMTFVVITVVFTGAYFFGAENDSKMTVFFSHEHEYLSQESLTRLNINHIWQVSAIKPVRWDPYDHDEVEATSRAERERWEEAKIMTLMEMPPDKRAMMSFMDLDRDGSLSMVCLRAPCVCRVMARCLVSY